MTANVRIPRVKICGVTRIDDLDVVADAGADAVGFNFVPGSPRCVDAARAGELCARAGELGLLRIAVVMDLDRGTLTDLLTQYSFDLVQLHGTERPEIRSACQGLPIIKATSWSGRPEEVELVVAWLAAQSAADCTGNSPQPASELRAWLVDAYSPFRGGGTGSPARWDLLWPRPAEFGNLPLILAGGLRPDNVAAAIQATAADGVDTASGVEASPGIKDPALVRSFASFAR